MNSPLSLGGEEREEGERGRGREEWGEGERGRGREGGREGGGEGGREGEREGGREEGDRGRRESESERVGEQGKRKCPPSLTGDTSSWYCAREPFPQEIFSCKCPHPQGGTPHPLCTSLWPSS